MQPETKIEIKAMGSHIICHIWQSNYVHDMVDMQKTCYILIIYDYTNSKHQFMKYRLEKIASKTLN